MAPIDPASSGHPYGWDFDYDWRFECACGRRITVPATSYVQQRSGNEPHPVCPCGNVINVGQEYPALRDLTDPDLDDETVAQHFWYHSSTYRDWPSPRYQRDMAREFARTPWTPQQQSIELDRKCSLALHLGTYATAVENMLRRMHHQDTSIERYWLHQAEITLYPGDLDADVSTDLAEWWGDVPLSRLTDRHVRAIRYINAEEAPGSISLAVDSQVISRVRTIPLFETTQPLRATAAGTQATQQASNELADTEQLRPDPDGIPEDQRFESEMHASITAWTRPVLPQAMEFAQRMEIYRDRQRQIWIQLEKDLVDGYLPDVNPWIRERVTAAIRTGQQSPAVYHDRIRAIAALLVRPHIVLQDFDSAPWRPLGGSR